MAVELLSKTISKRLNKASKTFLGLFAAVAFSGQFQETWANLAAWTTAFTGTGFATTSSPTMQWGTNAGIGTANLTTNATHTLAGGTATNSIVFQLTATTTPRIFWIGVYDAAQKGFGISWTTAAFFQGSITSSASGPTSDFGLTYTLGQYLRFSISGSNYVIDVSTDGVSWTAGTPHAFPVGMNTAALTLKLHGDDGGFGGDAKSTIGTVTWT